MSKINNNYTTKLRLAQIRKYARMHLVKTEADMRMIQHMLRLIYLR